MKKTASATPPAAPEPITEAPPVRRRARGVLYTLSADDVAAKAKDGITLEEGAVINATAYPSGQGWSLIANTPEGRVLHFPNRTQATTVTPGQWHDINPTAEPTAPPTAAE